MEVGFFGGKDKGLNRSDTRTDERPDSRGRRWSLMGKWKIEAPRLEVRALRRYSLTGGQIFKRGARGFSEKAKPKNVWEGGWDITQSRRQG